MRNIFLGVHKCQQLDSFGAAFRIADRLHSNKWTRLMALEAVKEQPLREFCFVDLDDFRYAAQLSYDVLDRYEYVTSLRFGRCSAYHAVWRYIETMKATSRRQIDVFTLRPTGWSMKVL